MESDQSASDGLRVAIEGCCHGELDAIYATLRTLQERGGRPIDLLICCGDFQAVRNLDDLECMACPPKYRSMASFWKYYSGQAVAPVPTLFIGGNHEATNHLWELSCGGWVAPNIYYLGDAGVVQFGGLRIGGLSGIYNARHASLGHFERPPYTGDTMRSAYHVRTIDSWRLKQLRSGPDIMLSHDWPRGIARYGDLSALLSRKGFLRAEIEDNSLGSPLAEELLHRLKPSYWFSAHLHTKFAALVRHSRDATTAPSSSATRFLALDKCLPRRQFLQVVDFPEAKGPKQFCYDAEWAAVLRASWNLSNWTRRPTQLPANYEPSSISQQEVEAAAALLRDNLADPHQRAALAIPEDFERIAPVYDPRQNRGQMPRMARRSPQTLKYLAALGLAISDTTLGLDIAVAPNPEEIDLGDQEIDDDGDQVEEPKAYPALVSIKSAATADSMSRNKNTRNPEEIALDDEDD